MVSAILDQNGKPYISSRGANPRSGVGDGPLTSYQKERLGKMFGAKYDAAQNTFRNENHWAQADHLSPNASANYQVRWRLRSRSRYECQENNPYLKGVILSLANDFIGKGVKWKIVDQRIPRELALQLENFWSRWAKHIKQRIMLWQMKMAKTVDGESFLLPYFDPKSKFPHPLNFWIREAEECSSNYGGTLLTSSPSNVKEIDGVRLDSRNNPLQYYFLNEHPGTEVIYNYFAERIGGKWVNSNQVIHWLRQDRRWWRGIPETTPSLPLCALLRRYTLAVVQCAEVAADITGVIESEGPPNPGIWTDEAGNLVADNPFDSFPIERGMLLNLPWNYKVSQLRAEQPTTVYDSFVNALLREIVRPLLVPFNVASGSSADSNMASGTLDAHMYEDGIEFERNMCEDYVLEQMLWYFWTYLVRDSKLTQMFPGLNSVLSLYPDLMAYQPEGKFGWDKVLVDHTDPLKVANSLVVLRNANIITDRDIQEERFNRDVNSWREEVREDILFDEEVGRNTVPGLQEPSEANTPDD